MKIRLKIFLGMICLSSNGIAATSCGKKGDTVTGYLTTYGADSTGQYTKITLKEKDTGKMSSLTNQYYPLSTPSGQAIDKTLVLAYTSGLPTVVYCMGPDLFASIQVTRN